ncbi:MAG: sigma-70 family RNA polymerase sigma factor [Deltaproteobacteria bacterium]|nr:sigma-70 family RNA polymerase sigma factor [Deltaproteobacteria bacterium]
MSESIPGEITQLLRRWSGGDAEAAEQVLPLIYRQLHNIAVGYFSQERSDHTLQPTIVVHEAFLRLRGPTGAEANEHPKGTKKWENRRHFFGIAARLMRQVLVDYARQKNRLKRGSEAELISLTEAPERFAETPRGILAIDHALEKLRKEDARKASVVELRFFGGLDNDELADFLGVSKRTIIREWLRARAWLFAELSSTAK